MYRLGDMSLGDIQPFFFMYVGTDRLSLNAVPSMPEQRLQGGQRCLAQAVQYDSLERKQDLAVDFVKRSVSDSVTYIASTSRCEGAPDRAARSVAFDTGLRRHHYHA